MLLDAGDGAFVEVTLTDRRTGEKKPDNKNQQPSSVHITPIPNFCTLPNHHQEFFLLPESGRDKIFVYSELFSPSSDS